ncbi:hypothetical protein L596_011960 [Steinernema carpocapsae]|uniref:BTB domain-containing protein n=1 Tax=Steinernema carpocapsae TaxID=34508 RepID=A0A4U5NVK2_STECR|nr:hypothetical protein L596_011960 [Steinernema carpocapsae]
MSSKGTIQFSFEIGAKSEIEIGGYNWSVEQRDKGNRVCCTAITCHPKSGKEALLWTCLVTLRLLPKEQNMNTMEPRIWTGTKIQSYCTYNFFWESPEQLDYAKICIEVHKSFSVDISERNNSLVKNPGDAAKVKIDGEEFWFSKQVLSVHSPYFSNLFAKQQAGPQRKRSKSSAWKIQVQKVEDSYELENVNRYDFLHFVQIMHCIEVKVKSTSIDYLLKMGEMYQCTSVMMHCEQFLQNAPVHKISVTKKLQLADRFKLRDLLTKTIRKVSLNDLRKFYAENNEISEEARDLLLERILA